MKKSILKTFGKLACMFPFVAAAATASEKPSGREVNKFYFGGGYGKEYAYSRTGDMMNMDVVFNQRLYGDASSRLHYLHNIQLGFTSSRFEEKGKRSDNATNWGLELRPLSGIGYGGVSLSVGPVARFSYETRNIDSDYSDGRFVSEVDESAFKVYFGLGSEISYLLENEGVVFYTRGGFLFDAALSKDNITDSKKTLAVGFRICLGHDAGR